MWKIPTGDSKIFTAHGEKVEAAQLLPDGKPQIYASIFEIELYTAFCREFAKIGKIKTKEYHSDANLKKNPRKLLGQFQLAESIFTLR